MTTRTLTLTVSLFLLASPSLAQERGTPTEKENFLVRQQLSDQVEDLLRGIRGDKTEVTQGILSGWKPTRAALQAVLTEEGMAALGQKVLDAAEETFAGTPAEIGQRLELDIKKLSVQVFQSSTESLQTMDDGTIAAIHFAAAVRHTARLFKPGATFYAVSMLEPEAPEDAMGTYLQLFVRHGEQFVYLGKLWRLEAAASEGEQEGE